MQIISHRGFWKTIDEKNQQLSFVRSFKHGFGTETDVRESGGKLVISHDIARSDSMCLDDFLCLYNNSLCNGMLALNIKSDGLQEELLNCLERYNINNYFVFDMSIPDTMGYLERGIKTCIRFSEYEGENDLWEKVEGIWYDSFLGSNLCLDLISAQIESNRLVAIVSSELHGRDPKKQWEELKKLPPEILLSENLILCTDVPIVAKEYFE